MQANINMLAVVAAALASMAIGMAWYSKSAFGKMWMSLSGLSEAKLKRAHKMSMASTMGVAAASSLVMSYVMAHFVAYAGATTIAGGLQAGFWLWLGFLATTMLGTVLWEGKPVKLYLLNAAYSLAMMLAMGAILAVWA